jgi:hypothetical protein
VVEASLGVPIAGAEKGVGALGIHLVRIAWGMESELLGTTWHKRGL